jgi:hypothetical protein
MTQRSASAPRSDENPTPRRVLVLFAEEPSYLPVRTIRLPDGLTLGEVTSGDLIGVEGRWYPVLGCTSVNGWVTVDRSGATNVTAHESTPVYLARREADREPVATRV